MNTAEREPLARLVPLCQERGVGVAIMKPVAEGLLPAALAPMWLLGQPIASAVPGATKISEAEEDSLVGREASALTAEEAAGVGCLQAEFERVRCRVCRECEPSSEGVPIGVTLGTDVMHEHYRTMGQEAFRSFAWSRTALDREVPRRQKTIAANEGCTRYGRCEAKCAYGLPVADMSQAVLPDTRDMLRAYGELLAN